MPAFGSRHRRTASLLFVTALLAVAPATAHAGGKTTSGKPTATQDSGKTYSSGNGRKVG